jgi:hypothetical protein
MVYNHNLLSGFSFVLVLKTILQISIHYAWPVHGVFCLYKLQIESFNHYFAQPIKSFIIVNYTLSYAGGKNIRAIYY